MFDNLISFLQSKGGSALLNAAGNGLRAYGDQQAQAERNSALFHKKLAEGISLSRNQDQDRDQASAMQTLAVDPFGNDQRFAQRSALWNAIVPNFTRVQSLVRDPGIATAMGQPRALFDPRQVNWTGSPQSTMDALSQRGQQMLDLSPYNPLPDLGSMFGSAANPYISALQRSQHAAQKAAQDARAKRNQALNGGIGQ